MKNKTEAQVINEQIKAFKVKVISEDGENLGVMARDAALTLARQKELDLVMLSDKDEVPLVKIMDFGKNLYMKKKKLAEGKKKQKVIKVKEIKMRPKIGEHDYVTKINQAIGFLQEGHKLKVTLVFSGREIESMHAVGNGFFNQVDQTFAQRGMVDIVHEKDASSGRFWSKIYHLKAKK